MLSFDELAMDDALAAEAHAYLPKDAGAVVLRWDSPTRPADVKRRAR
jgi:hypothetical protein